MNRPRKGVFGRYRYPVSDRYVEPEGRNRFLLPGLVAAALLAGMLAINFTVGSRRLLSGGDLTTAHASLPDGCASCHVAFDAVDELRCASCHAPDQERALPFGWIAHATTAPSAPPPTLPAGGVLDCTACHDEHRGRDHALGRPADRMCQSCHEIGVFATDHPEFRSRRDDTASSAGLIFTHPTHVRRILERDSGQPEDTCATCHLPSAGGSGFLTVAFDTACADCHLGAAARVGALPIRPPGVPLVEAADDGMRVEVGVEALETLIARRGPGEGWAQEVRGGGFRRSGNRVTRTWIEHRDRWILHNLRQVREALHGNSAGSNLVDTTVSPGDPVAPVYEEAIARLREQADDLRDQPEPWVAGELEQIRAWLADAERRLGQGAPPLSRSWLDPGTPDPRLTDSQRADLRDLADRLTAPCQTCHVVDATSFRRVAAAVPAQARTRFDHRPHRQQLGCFDCHDRVEMAPDTITIEPVDDAPVLNLPGIDRCAQCHTPDLADLRCVSCHVYHPGGEPHRTGG